jgi:pyridoxal phosphate enzyme (YggS family)
MEANLIEQIQKNFDEVKVTTEERLAKVNRPLESVKIITVSKMQPVDVVRAAIQAGVRIFGENYAEEAVEKIRLLGNDVDLEWHMIGHIQSRKVKFVWPYFQWIHSLDSIHLAEKFETQLETSGRRVNCLFEFNIAGEENKSGWNAVDEKGWADLLPEIKAILGFPHLNCQGIMVMPPLTEDPEDARPYFKKAKRLLTYLSERAPSFTGQQLSMGTSNDYFVAVEEGATMIRVGESILGPRKHEAEK